MPARRKKPVSSVRQDALAEAHFSAETVRLPYLGANGTSNDPILFRSTWTAGEMEGMFTKARQLLRNNDFFGGVHHLRLCYFSDGFHFMGENSPKVGKRIKKWKSDVTAAGLRLDRLELDIWSEFLTCDNAIVFWRRPAEGECAKPVVLNCETVVYSDALGVESLKVKPVKVKLTEVQEKALGKRWTDAIKSGKAIELDADQGEYFKVLTWGKLGGGLGYPRLGQIVDKLGMRELLEIADWSGAWEHGDVLKQIKKGHEITNGPHAGDPTHFIKKKQTDKIMAAMKGKRGSQLLVTNFDVSILWNFLDPKFFDSKKYDGVMGKLKSWAGAPALMYDMGQVPAEMMTAFATEGRKSRGMVGTFLSSILNDPTFYGTIKPPIELEAAWNDQSFLDTKIMIEWVRAGYANGLISPQTARRALGVNTEQESALMKEAHKDPTAYQPVFEAKQGIVAGKPGRPSDKPGAESAPTTQE